MTPDHQAIALLLRLYRETRCKLLRDAASWVYVSAVCREGL